MYQFMGGSACMTELHQLSRIGFGGYRITSDSKEHYQSLVMALAAGCNLIDTSSNYMDGKSEELIGQVLTEYPEYHPFIITKAGYIQGKNLQTVNELITLGMDGSFAITIDEDFKYSLHPDFLQHQLLNSLSRMGIKQVDGFLLHNPEYYVEHSTQDVYALIEKAFEYLETEVTQKKIRYYGISSNAFSLNSSTGHTLSLKKVLKIAQHIHPQHHFKLIQFPFNLLENEAELNQNGEGSIIHFAQQNNLITFSNRPLNANAPSGAIRLADYEKKIEHLNPTADQQLVDTCLQFLSQELKNLSTPEADIMEIDLVKYIYTHWNQFTNTENLIQFFDQAFYPFLVKLYQNQVPQEHLQLYSQWRSISLNHCLKNMHHQAMELKNEMIKKGTFTGHEQEPLQYLAVQHYLNSGINHVLVGMKKTAYIDDFKSLFF